MGRRLVLRAVSVATALATARAQSPAAGETTTRPSTSTRVVVFALP